MANGPEKPAKRRSKTAFVLSQPEGMSAKDVVDKAKKAGLTISDKYVYVVRSNARRRARKYKRAARRAVVATTTNTGGAGEREFRRLTLQLGFKRAEQLLSDTKKKAEMIAGK